jgi:hypothetical protein
MVPGDSDRARLPRGLFYDEDDGIAMVGMAMGITVNLYVKFETPIAWTWYVLIGTGVTAGVAMLASLVVTEREGVSAHG